MKTFTYTITDPIGIHARPAGLLVKEAQKFQAAVTIKKDGKTADMKKLFAVMGLGVKQRQEITINIEGADETEAAAALEEFVRKNF